MPMIAKLRGQQPLPKRGNPLARSQTASRTFPHELRQCTRYSASQSATLHEAKRHTKGSRARGATPHNRARRRYAFNLALAALASELKA